MKTSTSLAGIAASLLLLVPSVAIARQGTPPLSRQIAAKALQTVQQFAVEQTDPQLEKAADARKVDPGPLRYAVGTPVLITPVLDGTWEAVPGGRIWRLRVASQGATDLNFAFTTFWLPEGATLHISSETEDYFQGPYTAQDNKPHEQLWTPVIPGPQAVIELFVPDRVKEEPRIVLSRVNRGYRDMFRQPKEVQPEKTSGPCNIDVACTIANPWRDETRSVARYSVNGEGLCTGTLINNAAGDARNFFLTANHCGITAGNAASVVVYWNYQSPTCGQHGGGSLSQNQNGAIFRAAKADVDMALVELEDVPSSSFNVFYAGWSRSSTAPSGAVGIHHPDGDVKAISVSTTPLGTVSSCIDPQFTAPTHWQVVWSDGTTEPGSSGSAIWDPLTHRVVGFLSGGGASCTTPNQPDCYGKFSVAWTNSGSSATRLCDWLDPQGTGLMSVPGQNTPGIVLRGTSSSVASESCTPGNGAIDPSETVTVSLSLQNFGTSTVANVTATLVATNGVRDPSGPQNYGTLNARAGNVVARNFSFLAIGTCGSVITPTLRLHSGTTDLGVVTFAFTLGRPASTFTQRFDTVTAPALPPGWVNAALGTPGWSTVSDASDTAPNSAFAPATFDGISDASLTSPATLITTSNAVLTFRHRYDLEEGFDGAVLEVQINNGPFNDIISAGGSFLSGGYNFIISDEWESPIESRGAWTGDSGGFVTTEVALPPSTAGQNIRLRWRVATDLSFGEVGWWVDTVAISEGFTCCRTLLAPQLVDTRNVNNNVVFSINSVPEQIYVAEFQTMLSTGLVWTAIQTNLGDGNWKSFTNNTGAAAQRFIRVRTQHTP